MPLKFDCYCASLRQAARAISQKYDAALRGTGLTITQFTLLNMIAHMPRVARPDQPDLQPAVPGRRRPRDLGLGFLPGLVERGRDLPGFGGLERRVARPTARAPL